MMNNFVRYNNNWVPGQGGYTGWAVNPVVASIHAALSVITWLLVIAILIALLRWLWKMGSRK